MSLLSKLPLRIHKHSPSISKRWSPQTALSAMGRRDRWGRLSSGSFSGGILSRDHHTRPSAAINTAGAIANKSAKTTLMALSTHRGHQKMADILQITFSLLKEIFVLIWISLKFSLTSRIGDKTALVQKMHWCQTVKKPLPELVITLV